MAEALSYIYYIFDSFVDLIFNRLELFSNVSVGWILISISLFALLIRSVLNLPKGINLHRPSETTYYDNYGHLTGFSRRRRL